MNATSCLPNSSSRLPRSGLLTVLATAFLLLTSPSLLAAPGGGKGKPGGGGGGGEDPPPNYDTVTTIAMPDGASEYSIQNLNNAGQAVGGTSSGGRRSRHGPAFLWTGAESILLPNPSGLAYGDARDISDNGLIVGSGGTDAKGNYGDNVLHAVWWAGQPGAFTTGNWNDLLPGGISYRLIGADEISSDGEFVSFVAEAPEWSNLYVVVGRVIRDETGAPTDFANLWLINSIDGVEDTVSETWGWSWGDLSLGTGLNALGQSVPMVRVCGWYGLSGEFGSAGPFGFVWELDVNAGTTSTIDLNPYPVAQNVLSLGEAVNGSGEVVFSLGDPADPNAGSEGYYWSGDPSTAPVFLGNSDTIRTYPYAIGPFGTAVGGSRYVADNQPFAFVWTAATGLHDLNTLVSTPNDFSSGYDINDAGQILVWGYSQEANGGRYMVVQPNGNW